MPAFVLTVIREEFRVHPKNTEVSIGSDAVIECQPPKGQPEPQIRWKKDDAFIDVNERLFIDDIGWLHIDDARKEDAGLYVCVAYNIGGERDSTAARISIRGIRLIEILFDIYCLFYYCGDE